MIIFPTFVGQTLLLKLQIVTASQVQFSCCCQTFCDDYQENFATNPSDEGGLWIQVLILVPLSILPQTNTNINHELFCILNLYLVIY